MYLLKLGFLFWKERPLKDFLTIMLHAGLLIWSIGLFVLQQQLSRVNDQMQSENVTVVFLSHASIHSRESQIQSVKIALASESITQLQWISGQEFLKGYTSELGVIAQRLSGAELKEFFPEYLEITGRISEVGMQKLRALSNVDSIESLIDQNKHYFKAFSMILFLLRLSLGVCVAMLCVSTAQMAIQICRSLTRSLKIIGAWGGAYTLRLVPPMIRGAVFVLLTTLCTLGVWSLIHYIMPVKGSVFRAWVIDFGAVNSQTIAQMLSYGLGIYTIILFSGIIFQTCLYQEKQWDT
jgi:hypothetical protein